MGANGIRIKSDYKEVERNFRSIVIKLARKHGMPWVEADNK